MKEYKTFSPDETIKVGKSLGMTLKPGDVICMDGDLGAGKTAFTSGIAEALGVVGYITSPTFTIVNEYNGRIPLYHFDVYRIADPDEMFDIGFDEYLDGEGVTVIEWASLIEDILPANAIYINITKDPESGPDARIIRIENKS